MAMEGNGWYWKAATTALFGLSATLLVKGCDEWTKTNAQLGQLGSDVKHQIERVAAREQQLSEIEGRLQALHDRMQARFDERREQADRILEIIDDRLDRLESLTTSRRPPPERSQSIPGVR